MIFNIPTLSDDIYRYVWDGKVQAEGQNPYTTYPSSPRLKSLQDEKIYPNLNSKNKYDPYQPVAQLFFLIAFLVKPDNIVFFKFLLGLFDLGTLFILIKILKLLKINRNRCLVYAWCPLVIMEISHSGHIDGMIVFFILLAILARLKGKITLTGLFLGLAIPIKLYAVILVPAFIKKEKIKMISALLLTLVLTYLPYSRAGWQIFRFLFFFQDGPRFNSGLRYVFNNLTGDSLVLDGYYLLASLIILFLVAIIIFYKKESDIFDFISKLLILSIVYVIFMPFLVGWYLLIIIPLLAISTSPGLFYISWAVNLSYLFYIYQPHRLPGRVRLIEFVPFFVFVIPELFWRFRSLSQKPQDIVGDFSEKRLSY